MIFSVYSLKNYTLRLTFLLAFIPFSTGCRNPLGSVERTDDAFCNSKEVDCDEYRKRALGKKDPEIITPTDPTQPDGAADPSQALWGFDDGSKYSFDSDFIEVAGGKAKLKEVDQTHDSADDFNAGTHVGTKYENGVLMLGDGGGCDGAATNCAELDESWTPKWNSIQGYWRLNGNFADSSGNSNTGTAYNNATAVSLSKLGSFAGSFDGTGDGVRVPHHASLDISTGDFTLSAWVNPTVLTGNRVVISKGAYGAPGYVLGTIGTGISCGIQATGGSSQSFNVSAQIPTSKWSMLTCVFDRDDKIYAYINGIAVSNTTYLAGNTGSLSNPLQDLLIGMHSNLYSYPTSGQIDEVVIWNSALSSGEVLSIYERQNAKYAGVYASSIINIGASESWSSIAWITSLPFGKELPGVSGNESSTDYASLVDSSGASGGSDLSDGLAGLWHFDEELAGTAPSGADFKDFSTNSNHGTQTSGLQTFKNDGVLGSSVGIANAGFGINMGNDASLKMANVVSTSAWVKPSQCSYNDMIINREGEYEVAYSGTCELWYGLANVSPGWTANYTGIILQKNTWTHIVFVYDSTLPSDNIKVFVNGAIAFHLDGAGAIGDTIPASNDFSVGGRQDNGAPMDGWIDEVAIWSRALHPSEILELYRRGANRVKFQVRSCDDSACDGETWIGPDGTASTYFSELHNCSSIDGTTGICNGNVNIASPSITFSDFVSPPVNNQYFQYRVIMESDDETGACAGGAICIPSVSSIKIGPRPRYFGGSPQIANKTPVSFSRLSSFAETKNGGCSPKYQISKDGSNFLYWNESSWATASDDSHANEASTINTNINSLGGGYLYWKSFLVSDTSESCELDELNFEYAP